MECEPDPPLVIEPMASESECDIVQPELEREQGMLPKVGACCEEVNSSLARADFCFSTPVNSARASCDDGFSFNLETVYENQSCRDSMLSNGKSNVLSMTGELSPVTNLVGDISHLPKFYDFDLTAQNYVSDTTERSKFFHYDESGAIMFADVSSPPLACIDRMLNDFRSDLARPELAGCSASQKVSGSLGPVNLKKGAEGSPDWNNRDKTRISTQVTECADGSSTKGIETCRITNNTASQVSEYFTANSQSDYSEAISEVFKNDKAGTCQAPTLGKDAETPRSSRVKFPLETIQEVGMHAEKEDLASENSPGEMSSDNVFCNLNSRNSSALEGIQFLYASENLSGGTSSNTGCPRNLGPVLSSPNPRSTTLMKAIQAMHNFLEQEEELTYPSDTPMPATESEQCPNSHPPFPDCCATMPTWTTPSVESALTPSPIVSMVHFTSPSLIEASLETENNSVAVNIFRGNEWEIEGSLPESTELAAPSTPRAGTLPATTTTATNFGATHFKSRIPRLRKPQNRRRSGNGTRTPSLLKANAVPFKASKSRTSNSKRITPATTISTTMAARSRTLQSKRTAPAAAMSSSSTTSNRKRAAPATTTSNTMAFNPRTLNSKRTAPATTTTSRSRISNSIRTVPATTMAFTSRPSASRRTAPATKISASSKTNLWKC